ncbi:hemerythrin domain-containing protein [Neisseria zalophi]|uniref:Hemerythrin domain-containing protein n=1 Tax=Neisseria zalophi TaxID=640030 RepID=A0A5J6PXZ4_9NEIS|nr:hemerythrin domain-containing protein [Neisseria zalophi]QEY27046.1 hemerythrin domain-containing protein [Neisseria zalophi]
MKPLKRHPYLVQLSREHHHALVLCLRILREPHISHQAEIEAQVPELLAHFLSEERQFAPYWPQIDAVLKNRFETDHALLRKMIAEPEYSNADWNTEFAQTLRAHARFEERELFPAIEPFLN